MNILVKRRSPSQEKRPRLYSKSKTSIFLENLKTVITGLKSTNIQAKHVNVKPLPNLNSYFNKVNIKIRKAYIGFLKTITSDEKRKNIEFKVGAVSLGIIFLSSGTFTAATAYAPTVREDNFQTITVSPYAESQPVSRDGIVVTYVPRTNVDTYGPEADTFTNDRGGLVQFPFMRGVPISDVFGERPEVCADNCKETTFHSGLDFGAAQGAEIQAVADGVVIQVVNFKDNVLNEADTTNNDSGTFVKIQHNVNGESFVSLYAHLQYNSSPLVEGQHVQVGDFVGKLGNTGVSTGAHLHLGIQLEGKWVDPMPFIVERNKISYLSAR